MKRKVFTVVSVVLTVATLVAIWLFSAQDAAGSSALSGSLAKFLSGLPAIGEWLNAAGFEAILRKIAHGTIYAVLGLSLSWTLMACFTTRKAMMLTLVLGAVYAGLDEFHQSFVPGRGPSVGDVLIDTAGVLFGMLIGALIYRWLVASSNPDQR